MMTVYLAQELGSFFKRFSYCFRNLPKEHQKNVVMCE